MQLSDERKDFCGPSEDILFQLMRISLNFGADEIDIFTLKI
jgi:hypothetical protein